MTRNSGTIARNVKLPLLLTPLTYIHVGHAAMKGIGRLYMPKFYSLWVFPSWVDCLAGGAYGVLLAKRRAIIVCRERTDRISGGRTTQELTGGEASDDL
jgi:hypothetical protein